MSAVCPIQLEGAIRWTDWTVIVASGGRGWVVHRIGVRADGTLRVQHDPDATVPAIQPRLDTARARANILNGAF
jgi:hypothetical protein